ncbi:ATP synthase F1 subunit delta [bacterium]|nr:ATP synthase F1 subunit delta [bacterium]MCI0605690.1 ATP synthase F1 subunit delta [bacterium]
MKRDILISTIARRYSRAMLEVSIKQRNFSTVLEELENFAGLLGSTPHLRTLFANPAISSEAKQRVLKELSARAKYLELTFNFLKTLIHRDRLNLLDQVIVSAEQQFLEKQGIMVIEVITAQRLSQEEESRLVEKLQGFTGKKVQLENRVDPSLIGGVITRIGTTLYDGSVQAQLEQLRAKIQEA